MKISSRDTEDKIYVKSYLGQTPFHDATPYPSSTMIPSLSNPDKYENQKDYPCQKCGEVLILKTNESTKEIFFECSSCGGRYSKKFIDKGFSNYGTKPGTLDYSDGSNSNNESGGGPRYHEPMNRDTFSGNLGGNGPHTQ